MSAVNAAGDKQRPDPELVEAFAKQLLRSENRPDLLWDTKLFERTGRSIEGLEVASDAANTDYRRRAQDMLIGPA